MFMAISQALYMYGLLLLREYTRQLGKTKILPRFLSWSLSNFLLNIQNYINFSLISDVELKVHQQRKNLTSQIAAIKNSYQHMQGPQHQWPSKITLQAQSCQLILIAFCADKR